MRWGLATGAGGPQHLSLPTNRSHDQGANPCHVSSPLVAARIDPSVVRALRASLLDAAGDGVATGRKADPQQVAAEARRGSDHDLVAFKNLNRSSRRTG